MNFNTAKLTDLIGLRGGRAVVTTGFSGSEAESKLTLDEIGPRGGIGLLVAGFTADEGGMSAIDAMLPIVSPLFAVVDCAADGVDGMVVFEGPGTEDDTVLGVDNFLLGGWKCECKL